MSQKGHPLSLLQFIRFGLLPDDFSFPGKELFQAEVIAVEYTIGEIADPVPQADHPAVLGNGNIIGNMAVPKDKVFDFGVLFQCLPGILHLVFAFSTQEGAKGSVF